ncbi:glycoside hydrolase family 3 protein [Candidatus Marinimicrobia bacterium]|nr:glycoside hydrolase family 3 protein [Candidatus Neomarinimicrobiota bacterium]
MKIKNYISSLIFCLVIPNIDHKVDSLVSIMTLEEKIGQMTQVEMRFIEPQDIKDLHIGSLLSGGGGTPNLSTISKKMDSPLENNPESWVKMYNAYQDYALDTRLGIPLIYGIDAVHGHNNVYGATIFPHNIGLGCTFDTNLVEKVSYATSVEVLATGLNWTFSPCIAIPLDERWGRHYEGYSESSELVAKLGYSSIVGYQKAISNDKPRIAACAKHFIGDGGTIWGTGRDDKIDRGNTPISEQILNDFLLPPYEKAVKAGVKTIMASYNSINDQKCHGSSYLFNDLLKDRLGFEGFVISDWRGIDELQGNYKSDIITSINAGIDMVMVPGDQVWGGEPYTKFINLLQESVTEGSIPMGRIDDAVKRILKVKFEIDLFKYPKSDNKLINKIGSKEHRLIAREAVRKSIVMLKNKNNILPLKKSYGHIHIAGSGANDIGIQCGGWTIEWQGKEGAITKGTTIFDGIAKNIFDREPNTKLTYSNDGSGAENADIAILVLSEKPYAEWHGDDPVLQLSKKELETFKNIKKLNIPIITILISGRPLMTNKQINESDAFLAAWLPGSEGGDGIADILFGDYSPTGKLAFSWPKDISQVPINNNDKVDPLFPFGFGLTYKIELKNITSDELTNKREAVIFFENMIAVVEENERVAGGKVLEIKDDYIIFEKDNKTEHIHLQ